MVQRQKTWLSIQKEFKTCQEMTSSWPASPDLTQNGSKHEDSKFSYLIASKTASAVILTCLGILEFIVFYLKLNCSFPKKSGKAFFSFVVFIAGGSRWLWYLTSPIFNLSVKSNLIFLLQRREYTFLAFAINDYNVDEK